MLNNRSARVFLNILRKPTAVANFVRYALYRKGNPDRPSYLPFTLDIEPSTFCNYKCTMCHVSDPNFPHTRMKLVLFKKIIDDNPQLLKIKLQGMGEPLLCPDFFDMVEYAIAKGVLVQTTTNGSMLIEKNIERLAGLGLTSLSVSLDGATAPTFETIRKGADFAKVCDNARQFAKALKTHGSSTRFRAWTVLQKANMAEAEDIVLLAKELGFHEIFFQPNLIKWGKADWEDKNRQSDIGTTATDIGGLCSRLVQKGRQAGLPAHIHKGDVYYAAKPCIWPWHSAFIDTQGNVVPCCILGDARVKCFGTLQKESLSGIWNSASLMSFRESHKRHAIPACCRGCYPDSHS